MVKFTERPADLPDPLPLEPLHAARPFDTCIRPPGSKSLTNRALLLAALSSGHSTIRRPLLDADDAERMIAALRQLGAGVLRTPGGDLEVSGVDGRWKTGPAGVEVNLNNAGTATRFLAAAALLAPGPVTIDGNARMRDRPIGELTEALEQLHARCEFTIRPGFPPVRIHPPPGLAAPGPHGFTAQLGTTQSGQFISALLMIGPWLPGGITLRMTGPVTSASYVEMTLGLLSRLGATVKMSHNLRVLRVAPPARAEGDEAPDGHPRGLPGFEYNVEPDASGATYFWGAAAVVPGAGCHIPGLGTGSLQGDARFPELLERMGAGLIRGMSFEPSIQVRGPQSLRGIDADMIDMPDAAMTLAAVACFAEGPTVLRGLRTLRVKETDRIAAVRNELTKIGIKVECPVAEDPDAMSITPPPGGLDCSATAPRVEFDTYDDHRMAMSLAIIGLRRPNTFIRNPGCVAKTYPTFWRDWGLLYA
ncbi:MAG: 3-phosphoshikimate 1-carboxyvinyltransferase [Phycisphaerales bacterium]|nr:3-phosphoshikimate 1-carboxyvinyltransferase [Phycisphaerales bacterium]